MSGSVSGSTTNRNLFWFIVAAALTTFYSCAHLQWMEEQDEADRIDQTEQP